MGTLISNNEQETCTEYFKRVCIFAENKKTRHTEADQGIDRNSGQLLKNFNVINCVLSAFRLLFLSVICCRRRYENGCSWAASNKRSDNITQVVDSARSVGRTICSKLVGRNCKPNIEVLIISDVAAANGKALKLAQTIHHAIYIL